MQFDAHKKTTVILTFSVKPSISQLGFHETSTSAYCLFIRDVITEALTCFGGALSSVQ